jgi:sugar transferase (PEP-CTERM/EpsH1 system associated)
MTHDTSWLSPTAGASPARIPAAVPLWATPLPDLLVLAPCLPAPGARGDRLRWYHMLRFLSRHFRVHLGCFADQERERAQLARVQALCYETCFVPRPRQDALHRLAALARGESPTLPRYRSAVLAAWVERLLRHQPVSAALACSARMAGYLASARHCTRVIDFVQVESERRQRAALGRPWPFAALHRRDAALLFAHERALAGTVERTLFSSASQACLFGQLAPECASRTLTLGNGVDADYFCPHIVLRNPLPANCRVLVFAGLADDRLNADAAAWFARQVFPRLHAADPALRFCVAGDRPQPRARELASLAGVIVAADVTDLRPYLAHAALVVAPQQAPDAQTCVLEAMAMQKLVVASPQAAGALAIEPDRDILLADGAEQFASQVHAALHCASHRTVGRAARARALSHYSWASQLAPLADLLQVGRGARPIT